MERPASLRPFFPLMLVLSGLVVPNAILVSLINVALPDIRDDFAVGPKTLAWASAGYIIAGAIGAIIYSRLADIIGLKRACLACLIGFALASLGVALAPVFATLVLFRVLQGFFGMALPALSLATVVRALPLSIRGWGVGIVTGGFGLGLILGGLPGGIGIELSSWRAPFFATGILGALLLLPIIRVMPAMPGSPGQRFDVVGGLMAAGAVATTLLAINQLPSDLTSLLGLIGLGSTLPLWSAFLWWIGRADEPFIVPSFLRNVPFLGVCGIGGAMQGIFVGSGFIIPLVLRDLSGSSFVNVSLHLLPGFVAVMLFAPFASRLAHALGDRRLLVSVSSVFLSTALLFALAGIGWDHRLLTVFYAIFGAGYAAAQPSLISAASRYLPSHQVATGIGFYWFVYFAGGALAVALEGGVLERRVGASDAWSPFYSGPGSGYADSLVVLVLLGLAALILSLRYAHRREAVTSPAVRGSRAAGSVEPS